MEHKTESTEPRQVICHQPSDPRSVIGIATPAKILSRCGPPKALLTTSLKTEKCLKVQVLARVLYLTPGVLCSHATSGCRSSCLGHSSGRMQMPTHSTARDRRTALYLANNRLFIARTKAELLMLSTEAALQHMTPAARLNGSSDLPWELYHPEVFAEFPEVQFFDYTKSPERMHRFLNNKTWPKNYHLTFSAAPGNHDQAKKILAAGGTVAVVFWPTIPSTFWGYPVLNGDTHDARFFDPKRSVVALIAKGLARKDRTGFTVHVCPTCVHAGRA